MQESSMINRKYKYVFFIPWNEYAEIMYSDLYHAEGIITITKPHKDCKLESIIDLCFRFHFTSRFSKYLPCKKFWNKFFLKGNRFGKDEKLCFVFFMSDLHDKRHLFGYLKNRYPLCKFAIYLEDTVVSRIKFDFLTLNKYFDLVLSYDRGDCSKYNFHYYPTPYSKAVILNNSNAPNSDLFFCGLSKKRHQIIKDIFQKCQSLGITCDFHLVQAPKNDVLCSGINYYNKTISYTDYLRHMALSKCILDINQQGAVGFTLRFWEALVYGKKLITNNRSVLSEPFYDERQFKYIEDIDTSVIDFIRQEVDIKPRYINELSPLGLVEFIDKTLK